MKEILALFLVAITSLAYSQDTLVPEWIRLESSSIATGNAEAWCVETNSSGDVFWGVNQDSPGLFEFMDAYSFRLDPNGNTIWADTSITGQWAQQSYVLAATDTIIYLAGRTCSSANLDDCDALVFAVDASLGDTLWSFTWDGGTGYEEIDGLVPKNDGIYITGWTKTPTDEIDITLMKLQYNGNLLWQNQWGSGLPRDDRQDGHIVVDDSMIYLCGVYDSSPGLAFEGLSLLAKFDRSNGNFVDTTLFGRQDPWTNAEDALGMSSDGTYLYLTGYTTSAMNDWDLFAAKYDKNLNQIWYTVWGGLVEADVARSIQPSYDGSIFIAGTTRSYGNGEEEAVLIKLDQTGNPMWFKTWGAANDDHVLDLHLDSNLIYISGKTNSYHPSAKWEAFLMKLNMDSLAGNNVMMESIRVPFYPNPSAGLFVASITEVPDAVSIHNSLGQKLPVAWEYSNSQIEIDMSSFSYGIYSIRITIGATILHSRLIKN